MLKNKFNLVACPLIQVTRYPKQEMFEQCRVSLADTLDNQRVMGHIERTWLDDHRAKRQPTPRDPYKFCTNAPPLVFDFPPPVILQLNIDKLMAL